jgi:hypothetical protein
MAETIYNLIHSEWFGIFAVSWFVIGIIWFSRFEALVERLISVISKPVIFERSTDLPFYPRRLIESIAQNFRSALHKPLTGFITFLDESIQSQYATTHYSYYPLRALGALFFLVCAVSLSFADIILIANVLVLLRLINEFPQFLLSYDLATVSATFLSFIVGFTVMSQTLSRESEFMHFGATQDSWKKVARVISLFIIVSGLVIAVAFGIFRLIALGVIESGSEWEFLARFAINVLMLVNGILASALAFPEGLRGLFLVLIFVQWVLRVVASLANLILTILGSLLPFFVDAFWRLTYIGFDILQHFMITPIAAIAYAVRIPFITISRPESNQQDWVTRDALLEVTARDVEGVIDIASIADVAEVLTWLPAELKLEIASFPLGLRQVAERVRAALESDTDANRIEQLERATAEVTMLRQAQAWGKSAKVGPRLARALNVWQDILEQELARLREQASQLSIPNYYVAGSPLAEQSRVFKGRRDLFSMLERELAAQLEARPALLLLGPRRSGKTSTLRQLPSRLGPDFAPVEMDLLSAVTSENAAGLLGGIVEQIRDKALLTRRLRLPRPDKDRLAADPYLAFLQWLTNAEAHLDGKLILLNLDEYERLEEMIAQARLDVRIFQWLRSLIQSHPGVVVLLSGSHAPEELAPAWSDALINVRALRLGPLAEPDARELITAPVPNFPLQYELEAVEMILQATGRQPYLIQATCRDLVNYLNEERRLSATRADVEAAFDSALQTGAVYFNELWTSADTDDAQRAALRLLAHDDWLNEADLTRRAQLSSLTPLKKLIGRDLIENVDGGYKLRAGLVRRWIRRKTVDG